MIADSEDGTDPDSNEALYTYVVEAVAEGGAVMEILGTKDIQSICIADAVTSFNKDIRFALPDVGADDDGVDISFPAAATEYVTAPPTESVYLPDGVSCSQTYTYAMADSTITKPLELVFDESTGIFTLTNKATIKTSYEVVVTITTTDGINSQEVVVEGITITIECRETSTTLTPAPLDAIRKASVGDSVDPTFTNAEFITSNELCPVTSYSLTLDDGSDPAGIYTMTETLPTFTVGLNSDLY